jgi:hypothetical protein
MLWRKSFLDIVPTLYQVLLGSCNGRVTLNTDLQIFLCQEIPTLHS